MEQMCLAIRERGVTGELERKLEAADAQLERYRRRSEALHKQVKYHISVMFSLMLNPILLTGDRSGACGAEIRPAIENPKPTNFTTS